MTSYSLPMDLAAATGLNGSPESKDLDDHLDAESGLSRAISPVVQAPEPCERRGGPRPGLGDISIDESVVEAAMDRA